MKCKNAEEALNQAVETAGYPLTGLIHHSDRGIQYTCFAYMELLAKNGMQASRTEHGDPLENAVAERVNGILKQEWLSLYSFENEDEIRKVLIPAIEFYNKERPHASNNWLTPEQAYKQDKELKKNVEKLSLYENSYLCLSIEINARRECCSTPLPLRRSQSNDFWMGDFYSLTLFIFPTDRAFCKVVVGINTKGVN
ncbi:hypothetical protein DWX23_15325 [Parabacteroides sp. AF18-52]|jgi:integrase core domain protein|uniref:integrase core domain-containing protein n=1 Tax=Parabacteroides TaxID=375288 RepID=UPI000F00FB8C|nr:integrase core domain-containing protein [Parabacteroides sp. AF18-52]RHR38305.1 hypothetical protein DWX23_15325 [Parabacteroides sp. AF18-52]